MSTEKLNFYPCTCKLVCYYCKCLPEIERKNELKLFRYHNKHSCSLESHQKFEKNGYYLTRRPTWKNGFCSNVIKEKTVEKIENVYWSLVSDALAPRNIIATCAKPY